MTGKCNRVQNILQGAWARFACQETRLGTIGHETRQRNPVCLPVPEVQPFVCYSLVKQVLRFRGPLLQF
jgi:hypothetical protein